MDTVALKRSRVHGQVEADVGFFPLACIVLDGYFG